jgi:hypothetical protein
LQRTAATGGRAKSPAKPRKASPIAVAANSLAGKVNGERREGVTEVVQQILRRNRGFFTVRTLVELINQDSPGSITVGDIGHLLWRLRRLGEIKLVDKGNSRKPHMYLKV